MFSLVQDGDEALKQSASEWNFSNPPAPIEQVEEALERLMRDENGIGFAANQMGLLYRVFAMQIDSEVRFYYNPEILTKSDEEVVIEEGCLSFPGLYFKVKRAKQVMVRYQDSTGVFHEETMDGIAARCFQHELDHLDGVCFTDRVSKLTLDMAKKKRDKRERKY